MKSARIALGLPQHTMAKRLGLTQPSISKMENGTLKIDRRTSLAIDALTEKAKRKKEAGSGLIRVSTEGSSADVD